VNQGWYASAGSSSRVIASAYKTSNTSQNNKRLLRDPIANGYKTLGAIESDSTITAAGGIVAGTGNDTLLKKVVNIGDWNMDSTDSVSVAHGLTLSKIRTLQVLLRNDADTLYAPISTSQNTNAPSLEIKMSADATNVFIGRLIGGIYDSTDFNSTSYNRGYITIEYIP
jgi:hypothetical protein